MEEEIRDRKLELMQQICTSVCEGNEFQALRFVRERNELVPSGMLRDEMTEWKYDLVAQGTLMARSLHQQGVSGHLLDNVFQLFMNRIFTASDQSECRLISEEMTIRYCQLSTTRNNQTYPMLIRTVLQEIDRDLSQPLSLQHLADTLNVNKSYLSGLFSSKMGVTLTEYVTEKRMTYAADLLAKTQYPIKTVAKKAGIPDVQYFSRLFKKRTGQTPSQYRLGANPANQ